jgi:type II secretion system protein N
MRRALIGGGALVWGLVVFIIALHVHFPEEEALARAKWEVQERGDGNWAIDASSADLWRLTGVSVDDLVLLKVDKPTASRRRRAADDEDEGVEDVDPSSAVPFLRADRARARLSLLPLLRGETEVVFDADVFGGALEGTVAQGEARRRLVVEGTDLDMSRVPIEGEDWRIDATGLARLDIDLDLDAEDVKASTGTMGLHIDDLTFDQTEIFGMSLDPATFSEAALELEIEDGKAKIVTGSFIADLLEVEMTGNITLSAREWSRWRVKVNMSLLLSDSLESLAKFLPQLKDAKGDDDRYHLICTGSLAKPRCREDRSAPGVKSSKSRGRKSSTSRSGGLSGSKNLDADATEERSDARERRLERIRERRERLRKRREERAESGDDRDDDDRLIEPSRTLAGPRAFDRQGDAADFDPQIEDFDGDDRPGFDPLEPGFIPPDDFDQDPYDPPMNGGSNGFIPPGDDIDFPDDFQD